MKTHNASPTTMTRQHLSRWSSLAAIALLPLSATGQGWVEDADIQLVPGEETYGSGAGRDAQGNALAVGYAIDSDGNQHALLLKHDSSESEWTLVERFRLEGYPNSIYWAVASDQAGRMFAVGNAYDGNGIQRWLVRRYTDGVLPETVDDLPESSSARASDIAIDTAGTIYACGGATTTQGRRSTYRWLVRKNSHGGDPDYWHTVLDLPGPHNVHRRADGIVCVGTAVYVLGSTGGAWVVHKSTDGGQNWNVVDQFVGTNAWGWDITADHDGNLYVVGRMTVTVKKKNQTITDTYGIVRKGTPDDAPWTTIGSIPGFTMRGALVDSGGNLHVAGSANPGWMTGMLSFTGSDWLWNTTDLLQVPGAPYGLAEDLGGNMFAVGNGYDDTGVPVLRIRRLSLP